MTAIGDVLPRTRVRTVEQGPVQRVPLDSTRLLVAVEGFRGTAEPMRLTSPMDLGRKLERTGIGIPGFDVLDVAFREGVPEVYFARLLGPGADKATIDLAGAGGTSITLTAHEPGDWANGATGGLTAEVQEGPDGAGERVIIIRRAGTPGGPTELGRTTVETTRAGLIAALGRIGQTDPTLPGLIEATGGAEVGLPVVAAAANFAGGDADTANIGIAQVRAALDAVSVDEGPMQVVAPGRSTDAINAELLDYAYDAERTALLEQADGLAVATSVASAAAMRALGTGADGKARLGGMWAGFQATGPSPVAGQTRSVPWTVIVAGLIARLQAQEGHPNVSPFGDYGVPRWATGLTRTFTEDEAATLVAGGVNVAHTYLGQPRNRTFHTLELDGATDWLDLAHTRTDRQIHALARDVGRGMGARRINRETIGEFGGLLRTRIDRELWRTGALLGDTPDQAFRVDTDSVNDAASMAVRQVNAAVGAVMEEHAEFVNIDLTKVPIGQEV